MDDEEDFLAAVEADNAGKPVEEDKTEELLLDQPIKDGETKAPEEPAKEEAPAAEPESAPEPPATEQPKPEEGATAPIAALLDERDKRKALEAELARYREAQQQQPVQMPDPYEDPEGFAAAQQAQMSEVLYQQKLHFSEQLASVKHGEDTVKAAKEWAFRKCDEDPYFNAKVAASPDPIGYAVAEYKREEIASKVDLSEYEQFQAWKAAQSQLQTQQGQPPTQATPTSAIPPKSLASAPSAGSIMTEPVQSEEEMFNEVIPKG